ncbi:M10 family metallopeptidase C-terminal domain-containing protein [Pseudomonas chlororaphis]|uniref:M10 family metallopeptidase C-terminal domain-containing protein n=1 Tax=Pseudomonas chlororaphis TaxID=587753 RepID=UPI0035D448AA
MPTPSSYSPSLPASLTGVAIVDSLLSGTYWLGSNWNPGGPTNLSYSFMAPVTSYFVTNYSPDNEYNALYALTVSQQNAAIAALGAWSAVANINFTLTSDNLANVGDLRFGAYRLMDDKTAAWAYFPANSPVAGDVWIGPQTNDPNPSKGTYDYLTFVHEIGHALGLKHPFDTSNTNKTLLDPKLDDVHFTVMSYNSNYSYQPTTPMVLDILAIQSLYGANTAWQAGDNVYKWASDQSIFETIWDAGGNDTIDASNQLASVTINLNEGSYSSIGKAFADLTSNTLINDGLAIAYGAKIENAIGSNYNDVLIGNALNNVLNGAGGVDVMAGGAGNDTYILDNAAELALIYEENEPGRDLLTITYAAGAQSNLVDLNQANLVNVESVRVTGIGAFALQGNALDNKLFGNAGNDWLDGGAGIDTLTGGAGDDTYVVDNYGDVVVELAGEGRDKIMTTLNYGLGANIEDGQLIGDAALNLSGNELDNVLIGNAGNNVLNGGAGIDTMIGGAGNDTYNLDQAAELALIQENNEPGRDLLMINYAAGPSTNVVDLNQANLVNVESVRINGNGAFAMLGNALDNKLFGNAGNDWIDGGGGVDTLTGGAGDDTYVVDNYGDIVVELAGEGRDKVMTSIHYTLGANIEDGQLMGEAALNLTGNNLNNVLIGNAGNNLLNGGAGIDTMIGGAGNDTYNLDQAAELALVQEGDDPGRDLLSIYYDAAQNSVVDLNQSNLLNVESVRINSTGAFTLLGNALDNKLFGTADANYLDGGAGVDTLTGGAGDDTYVVDNIGDIVVELAGEGRDLVKSSISYTLGANLEDGQLLGSTAINLTGNEQNNVLTGNDGNNILSGGAGNDTLNGGAGIDTMIGGSGNDTYIIDRNEELALIRELDETGRDLLDIQFDASQNGWITLNQENLRNVESVRLTGNGAFSVFGNALDNKLFGNAYDNTLDGGAGIDTLTGGAGNDTYVIDNVGDIIVELANEGIDQVKTSISYTLGANLENAQLLGSAALNLTGNELDNVLIGNDGDNILNGGAGADTMQGGAGNDTYILDESIELSRVKEAADGGQDWVVIDFSTDRQTSFINLDTPYLKYVENLRINGAGEFTLWGNALDNKLFGNADYNVLNGGSGNDLLDGGAGADKMIGGEGDDIYIVDNAGDTVTELWEDGHDLIKTSVSYTLSNNIEDGTLLGNAAINLTGNALNNVLTGNDGNNVLDGGAGIDTMIGGAGNDTYYLDDSAELVWIQEGNDPGRDLLNIQYNAFENNVVDLNRDNLLNVESVKIIGGGNFNVSGNGLDNKLFGNDDANYLSGGAGNDQLDGGAGNDILLGGGGKDTLIGGAGSDQFVFSALNETGTGSLRDVINDFNSLEGDKIDLRMFDANLLQEGINAFSFIGSADFTGAGQLRFVDHVLSGNVSGNAGADFEIQLVGVNSFSANDLVA